MDFFCYIAFIRLAGLVASPWNSSAISIYFTINSLSGLIEPYVPPLQLVNRKTDFVQSPIFVDERIVITELELA